MDPTTAIHTLIAHVAELHRRLALLEGRSKADADRLCDLIATFTLSHASGDLDDLLWDEPRLRATLANVAPAAEKYLHPARRVLALAERGGADAEGGAESPRPARSAPGRRSTPWRGAPLCPTLGVVITVLSRRPPLPNRPGRPAAPDRSSPPRPTPLLAALLALLLALLGSAAAQVVYDVAIFRQLGGDARPVTVSTPFVDGDRLRIEIAVDVGPAFAVAASDLVILLPVPEATSPSGGVTPGFATNWLDANFRVAPANLASFVNWSNLEPIPADDRVSLTVFFDVEGTRLDLAAQLLELPQRVRVGSASNAFEDAVLAAPPAPEPEPIEEVPGRDEVTAMQLFRVCSQIGFEAARLRCYDAAAEALGFEVATEEE